MSKYNEQDASTPGEPFEDAPSGTPSKKKLRRNIFITIGCVAAIAGIAAGGFYAWHQEPSFCGEMCHDTMNPYLEGWQSGDDARLVSVHAETGLECLDCHETTLSQQVSELGVQLSGDYSTPLKPRKIGTREFCLTCHDDNDPTTGIDWEDIYASTEDWDNPLVMQGAAGKKGKDAVTSNVNPHEEHHGEVQCYSCHSMHGQSTLYCNTCHDYPVPQGWASPEI